MFGWSEGAAESFALQDSARASRIDRRAREAQTGPCAQVCASDSGVITLIRQTAVVLAAVILLIGLTTFSFAQECRLPLFNGNLGAVETGSWGSGSIEVDEEESYLEGSALKVETTGFFAGGRLDLKEPLEASRFLTDPAGGYLKLVVKVHEPEATQPGMEPGMMFPGGFPGEGAFPGEMPMDPGMVPPEAMPPGMEPGMEPGMDPGMMDPGMGPEWMEPGMGGPMAPPEPPKKISRIRALLVTELGAIDSGAIEIADYPEIVEDWVEIVLPLDRFAGPVDISAGKIQHIALFGDVEETFWVGDVTIGYEEQPLLADAGENIVTKANAPTTFRAAPQPEGVRAIYVWDFDDLDGVQEEGYGPETTWTFITPGYYTVTLTVRDPDGKKVNRVDRVQVKVTE